MGMLSSLSRMELEQLAADLLRDRADTRPAPSGLSPEVIAFAKTMQYKLDKNKHKACPVMNSDSKGREWRNCKIEWLLGRLREEVIELETAIDTNEGSDDVKK
jgi:hypothetical protein